MKKLIVFYFFSAHALFCAEDTTKVFRMDEVVITGTSSPVAIEQLPSTVHVVDSVMLAQSNGTSVADVVGNSAGVFIDSYGGNGALQSVSVRGIGSDYTLVLVDGRRYTMFDMGTIDLGIFSLMDVDRIEIANGGNSSLYGADAVGGIVNIITKKPSGAPQVSVQGRVGSFGSTGYGMSASGGNEQFSVRGAMNMLNARNDYDFNFSDGLTSQDLKREGADYSLKNYSVSSDATIAPAMKAEISARYADANRGQPSAMTSPTQNNLARIHDKDFFSIGSIEMAPSGGFHLSLPLSFHYNYRTYNDPNLIIGNSSEASFYRNEDVNVAPAATFVPSSTTTITAGMDATAASITSNEVNSVTRRQLSGYVSSEERFDLPLELLVYPSIRYDSFSDTQGDVSPKIGVNVGILNAPTIRLRSSLGKNYHVPTFDDLYWIQGGNPNLQPERSLSFDAGVLFGTQLFGNIELEANYFSIKAKDKIVWQPGANGIWSPKNLQSVSSSGVEFSADARFWGDALIVRYTGNITRAVKTSADFPGDATQNKYLLYTPEEAAGVLLEAPSTILLFRSITPLLIIDLQRKTITHNSSCRHLTRSMPTCRTGFPSARSSVSSKGEINNLFNASYQIIPDYPMPLRNAMLTIEFTI